MNIAYYHVDCFTENLFCGNPAAVCILPEWLPEVTLQAMAIEHSLPATAFIRKESDAYSTRWFDPNGEIELCGHGSLAAAYVIFKYLHPDWQEVIFKSPRHTVSVLNKNNTLILNFPVRQVEPIAISDELIKALGVKPLEVYQNNTWLALLANAEQVRNLQLNITAFRNLPCRNLIITASDTQVDFVSRNFYPKKTIIEDPVTGSAHCILAPFWAKRLNKNYLSARQVSARGGDLICEVKQDRVYMSAKAVLYKQGEIIF